MLLREYHAQWRNGSGGKWLSERWTKDRVSLLKRYVTAFGHLPLEELRARHAWHVQRMILEAGLSNALVNRTSAAFLSLLWCAEQEELLPEGNHAKIAEGITWLDEPPSGKNKPFTPEERNAIVAAARRRVSVVGHSRWYVYTAFLAYTGCRPSEAMALRWANIDVEERWIRFVASSSKGRRGTGKNRKAWREVPMAAKLAGILGFLPRRGDDELVFTKPNGGPMDERYFIKKVWPAILKEAGPDVRRMTPHCLRHTFASVAAKNGTSRDDAAELIGNSPATMEKFYKRFLGDPLRIDIDKAVRTPKKPAPETGPAGGVAIRRQPGPETERLEVPSAGLQPARAGELRACKVIPFPLGGRSKAIG
jgi:integrase